MIQLTFDQARKASKRKVQFVPIPEFAPEGAEKPQEYGFHIMSLSLGELDQHTAQMQAEARKKKQDAIDNIRARWIARTICDENGARIATDAHWELFSEWDALPMSRLFDVALKLSGVSDNEAIEERGKDVKNGESTAPASA